ncbi:ComC/BlpC family leader-containing pheromone/bacteriocin [Labilibaculum euxinus]|uniref:Uncharacterized protein n=1 Tax=Labilibaculum euxinus TaxID=2686357 RepID=A0A7M4D0Z3_9BACT|nr:ComC/BlpC family leader-containing pheromone/bacteriocin [Labilibaculum euxinus]MUP36322.1 hypothetical protein [Labilibaculum euxinus]MVB05527.1 hypothetical protein [Labilibaculum euxinus]
MKKKNLKNNIIKLENEELTKIKGGKITVSSTTTVKYGDGSTGVTVHN